jgi:hypothetical protein
MKSSGKPIYDWLNQLNKTQTACLTCFSIDRRIFFGSDRTLRFVRTAVIILLQAVAPQFHLRYERARSAKEVLTIYVRLPCNSRLELEPME